MAEMKKRCLAFLGILAGIVALNAAMSGLAGFFFTRGAGDARYTQEHFAWPAIPRGMMADFGPAVVGAALLLVAMYLAGLFLLVARLPEDQAAAPSQSAPAAWLPENLRKPFWIVLAAIGIIAVTASIFTVRPMGGKNRLGAAKDFFVGFNRAAALKSRFDEKGYEDAMFDALMLNRDDFLWFARSGYWAKYADEGVVRWTDRKTVSADFLYRKFKSGVLADDEVGLASGLMMEVGDRERAFELVRYLQEKYPENGEYASLFAGFSAASPKKP